jgi:hypothetical protein
MRLSLGKLLLNIVIIVMAVIYIYGGYKYDSSLSIKIGIVYYLMYKSFNE